MKLDMVGRTPSELLGLQRDILERLSGHDGNLWMERYKRLHQGENPFAELVGASASADAWKDELIAATRKKLGKFSRDWARQVMPVPESWTPEFLTAAAAFNMRPVFFPDADISETFRHKKYVKPEQWFYDQVRAQQVDGDAPTKLCKGWAFADFTIGIDPIDGTQVLPNDPWASLITELRQKKMVGNYYNTPVGSRFAITWDEWIDCVLAHMASKLGVTRAQTSLERAVDFSFIGNVYDNQRRRFNMWQWFQDTFEGSHRLVGGHRLRGELARVDYCCHDYRHKGMISRPLVRFVQ